MIFPPSIATAMEKVWPTELLQTQIDLAYLCSDMRTPPEAADTPDQMHKDNADNAQGEERRTMKKGTNQTHQIIPAKDLPSLVRKPNLRNANLPSLFIGACPQSQCSGNDLMTKTHADDPYFSFTVETLTRELDELQDPWVVVVSVVLAAGDQDGVDVVQIWVRGAWDMVIYYVMARYHQFVGYGCGRCRRGGQGGGEECAEDAGVVGVSFDGSWDRRVRFEDGEAEGLGCRHGG
ncbi:hypothetical protein MKZ38_001071 [Zalerion maritima]|uniref:Uncharacterized protein n=1 Tax=Zalerion maritima TaxID=339359 RepID=A0AAD5RR91_9PEZI|nr:hypothetical protein MKZ38_001071 [Zalerion maritima]